MIVSLAYLVIRVLLRLLVPHGKEEDAAKDLEIIVLRHQLHVFKRYASRRHGSAAISGWLNDEAIHTKRDGRWTPQRVIDLLWNTTYIGELPVQGRELPVAARIHRR